MNTNSDKIPTSPKLYIPPTNNNTSAVQIDSNYRILSLDGGGIRGIVTAVLLERINKETNFLQHVNMAAGTSTGGLIALAIAHGVDITAIKNIYLNKGKYIFNDTWFDDVKDLFNLTGADYDSDNLISVLREVFGETRMCELKKHVLVTAFDLDNKSDNPDKRTWEPAFFSSFPFRNINNVPSYDTVSQLPVWKVAYYTAAAPTYFPSLDGYVDGGIFASNPAMEALCAAPSGDPVLLSLGTGVSLKHIEGDKLDWGYAQWLKPLVDMMMQGQQMSTDHQCRELIGEKYFRLAPVFPGDVVIDMDGVDQLDYMVKFAESVDISDTVKFVKENFI